MGKNIQPDLQGVGVYTGELIGFKYLFRQTGEVFQPKYDDDDVADPSSKPLSEIDDGELDDKFMDDNDEQTMGCVPHVFSPKMAQVVLVTALA